MNQPNDANPWAVTIGEAMGLTDSKSTLVTVLTSSGLQQRVTYDNNPAGIRTLSEIAREALACDTLKGDTRIYAGAYLEPMTQLESINDTYLYDSAKSIVLYALSNLSAWRREDARRIKAELKQHLKEGK